MRRSLLIAATLIAPLAAPQRASAQFTGQVNYKNIAGADTGTMVYLTKGNKAKITITMSGQKSIMIIDGDKMMAYFLNPATKQYFATAITATTTGSGPAPVATGRKLTIAGHACTEYKITTSTVVDVICVATDMGKWIFAYLSSRSGVQSSANINWFMLKGVERTLAGKFKSSMTVTTIKPETVLDSAFNIPAGYTKMNAPLNNAGN